MIEKKAKLSFILAILILFLGFSPNAFAAQGGPIPESIQINDNHLKMTGSNTGTFHYKILDTHGIDITSKIPASDISVDAIVDRNYEDGSGGRAKVSLDPSTGTCTLTYDFSNSKYVEVNLMYSKLYVSGAANSTVGNSQTLYIGESQDPYENKIYEINFLSDYLTKTGANTATFCYKLSNGLKEITKNIPASQLSAFTSVDSKVVLDPSTGTGTITFNSTDTDKPIKLTLTDKVTGIAAILNTSGLTKNPVGKMAASKVLQMNFLSSNLIKTGTDTATFNYQILDHNHLNITKEIPATDIEAVAMIGSSKSKVSLDPSTGKGTVTYNFSDADNKAMISLIHKTGVEASGVLNIVNSESENNKSNNSNDLEIAQISFIPTDILKGGSWLSWSELQYKILNKYGKDITREIPSSQINVSSSINSLITLVPKETTCRLKYNFSDTDRTIIVSLSDKLTGVKAALNIGDSPTAKDTSIDDTKTPTTTGTSISGTNTSTGSAITIKRLSGADRYATSAAVALSGWTQSNYAILASGENFPDAISAAPLAKKYDAPILLSEANSIPAETLNAIQQLKVKNIIIVGGTGSVSSAVEKQLASSGIAVTRIFGQDRYETCIKIAEQLDNVTEIAVVTGESFPDALSISPIAVKRNMPIILVSHNEIPSVVKDYINSHKLTTTYVIGSGTSLNNAVLKGLSNIELITGNDKYQVNLNIIDKFKSDLNLGTVYIASGEGFADALSGSILAGKNSNPLLLIGNDPSIEKNYFANNSINISNINVLGGIGVVPDEIINKFAGTSATTTPSSNSTPPATSKMDKIEFISTNLTKTGANTATFQYRVLDKNGVDITKTVPASEIGAVASASSSIILDPLTGKGTITFNSPSDNGNQVIVTLIDKVTGKLVSLNNKYSEPQPTNNIGSTSVAKIEFISTVLTKTGTNTATFQYRVLDKNGVDITKAIPASEINAVASVSSSIVLNPLTGTGTITFNNASSTGGVVIITLVDNINGIVGTIKYPSLNPGTSGVSENPRISKIMINSTLVISPNKQDGSSGKQDGSLGDGYATCTVLDQNGGDITGSHLANNIKYACDAGTVTVDSGLLSVTPNKGVDFTTLKSVVITAYDPNTGISTSATLTIDSKYVNK